MALVEGVVLYFWEIYPFLLAIFAGLRFTEILADWLYWGTSRQLTLPGRLAMIVLPPVHLLVGLYFVVPFVVSGG
jgi:hypothetical protein